MKNLLGLALLSAFLGLAPAQAQQSVFVPATTASVNVVGTVAGITKIISGVSSQRIYLTAVALHPASTSVVTLSQGTGTNCGTSTAVIYGPSTFGAQESWYQGSGYGALFALIAGNDLCITIGTAVAPVFISYSQF